MNLIWRFSIKFCLKSFIVIAQIIANFTLLFFDNMSDYSDQMIRPLLTYLNLNFELPFTMWNKCSPEKYISKQGFQRTSTYLHYQAKLEKEFQVFHGFEEFATQIMCSCRIWKCSMQAFFEIHWIEVYWFFLFVLFGENYLTSFGP